MNELKCPLSIFILISFTLLNLTLLFNNISFDQSFITISYFDDIANSLYQETSTRVHTERLRIDINEWNKRTGGGLSDDDRIVLGDLYFNANSVFEFGLGESTYIAAHTGVPRYAGVDSDANWVTNARDQSNMSHFRFYFADIGKTKAWGYPIDMSLKKVKYDYQIAALQSEYEPFDVYLIDGRYRIACACISFLHAMKYRADMNIVRVAVHDKLRKEYHVLEDIANVIPTPGDSHLLILSLKPKTTEKDIHELWWKYKDLAL